MPLRGLLTRPGAHYWTRTVESTLGVRHVKRLGGDSIDQDRMTATANGHDDLKL